MTKKRKTQFNNRQMDQLQRFFNAEWKRLPKKRGFMLTATWNINNFRIKKLEIAEFLVKKIPDILALQETKLRRNNGFKGCDFI